MIKKLILLLGVLISIEGYAQEFWTGTKNTTSEISRNGNVNFGYTRFRTNIALQATVIEHLPTSGSLVIRSNAGASGETGNLIFNDLGGNVGIGVSNPQARLAVNGNILAKEVKVKTDITVPDYVFEADYALPALAEVETYVREHKHLPEIPSAKDIERDGLDLAEMNLLLLKKVEELTLHAIEQEKRIRDLESKWITDNEPKISTN